MQCEVQQLRASESCDRDASYSITVSYLGRPALNLHLCKLHILDTWNLAKGDSELVFGNDGHVKSVGVKKL